MQPATAGLWAGRVGTQLACDCLCHQVIVIPKLHYAGIVEAGQDSIRRAFPIRRQNRLPDDEHLEPRIVDSFEQQFGCGGPPQAHRSRGRKQEHHPHIRS